VRASLAPLPADTVLVSYWLGSECAYAWVVSPTEIRWAQLPSPAAIAQNVAAFHHSLTRLIDMPLERRLQDARALYELIIRPIEPWLSGARQWVLIRTAPSTMSRSQRSEGRTPSRSLSFAMQHDVASTPAAWMLDTRGTPAEPHERRGLLLVADPVYQADDPRLAALEKAAPTTQAFDQASARPRPSQLSAPCVYPPRRPRRSWPNFRRRRSINWSGVNATRERLLSLDWSKYRFIHIATHGIVDAPGFRSYPR